MKKVRVYYNLHKKCMSIQEKINGRWKVVKYSNYLYLRKATFHVNETLRRKVIKEKRKNVHAWIEGFLCEEEDYHCTPQEIVYNPYHHMYFMHKQGAKPIFEAYICKIYNNKVFV